MRLQDFFIQRAKSVQDKNKGWGGKRLGVHGGRIDFTA